MADGIDLLRSKRGGEEVTFNDVADHLVDHLDRHPGDGEAVERLARFLARVEDVDHDHEAREEGSDAVSEQA